MAHVKVDTYFSPAKRPFPPFQPSYLGGASSSNTQHDPRLIYRVPLPPCAEEGAAVLCSLCVFLFFSTSANDQMAGSTRCALGALGGLHSLLRVVLILKTLKGILKSTHLVI